MTTHGQDYQARVYGAGHAPEFPVSYEGWESRARQTLDDGPFDYVAGGAGAEETMKANREAFDRWRIRPRMLRGAADRDLTTELLGLELPVPFMLAPVGVLSIIHPEAELAVARACAATGAVPVLSTVSSNTMEEVAAGLGDTPRLFQLYPSSDPEIVKSLLSRAEAAGYSAVVVTLDTTILGFRERDLENAYLPFLQGEGLANYLTDPAFRAGLGRPPEEDPAATARYFLSIFGNPALSWEDIRFIRESTSLPVILKGVVHPDDAREALESGVQGLVVSNHGGRQVDGAVAALDALIHVREAVGDRLPILFDSGVRRGADVIKALALGADCVMVGRPYAYGLAVGGAAGVEQVIQNLTADLDLELALSGHRSVSEVGRSALVSSG
ncbi:alpha-hydroxy-acid oxidizing protein [Rubrobacter aplysinae]|uniref:alpha-hydroxy-acid oxidizing protein n=1 Tax=Rubrobacter aplysinae TaxID=909625 RepID=UPI00064BFA0A|nr:alpha-hydroxy-acid oxidizing protein [Rubrobacter aplysinae]